MYKKLFLLLNIICFSSLINSLWAQHSETLKIVQKPIVYNEARKKLSLEYLKLRHGITQQTVTIQPKFIILHFTGSGNLNSNFNYFNNVEIENARSVNKDQSTLNVSAHYLVDRDGTIYQLMPENYFARHTIGLNYCAIGVENIGGPNQPLTEAQVKANAALVRHLAQKHKIEFLIGHSEYAAFRNTKWWKETNSKYYTGKVDPGVDFMKKVRLLVADLNLKSKP